MNVAEQIVSTTAPAAAPAQATATAEGAPPVAAPKEDDAISPKLGLIARKERALVQKQQEFQKQQQEWQKMKDELTARIKAMEEKENIWKTSPEKALEQYGHNYQTLTERMLAGGEMTPAALEKKFNERFQTLEQQREAEKKAQQEEQERQTKEAANAAVESYKEDLRGFIAEKGGEYKLVALFDKEAQTTYDTIDAYYQLHGKVLSHDEAASLVEKYFKKLVDEANGVLSPPKAPAEGAEQDEPTIGLSKTLSNQLQSTAPSMLPPKTENDRLKRAMAALG